MLLFVNVNYRIAAFLQGYAKSNLKQVNCLINRLLFHNDRRLFQRSNKRQLDIAANVSDIMKKADPIQQNKLLSLMFAECYLDGQKLIYKLQKPFDQLVNLKNANTWFDFDKSDIKEYETMAEKVLMYKIDLKAQQVNAT